jgi:uncharacterized membrane protein
MSLKQGIEERITVKSAQKYKGLQTKLSPSRWLHFLIIIVLAIGIFFRFANLDRKVYWLDETYTSLRISGYTEVEAARQVSQSQILSIQDLQNYQQVNSEKDVFDTIQGLADEEPQLPPLYFVLNRWWVQAFSHFGSLIAVTRSFSAVMSLLAFPCLYWLCIELFASPLVGWVAIALFAVSPFQVVYAQEARPYSLWVVTILLSSAALLQAMRLKTQRSWAIYGATVVLGLYSYLFFALVAIGHGIYILLMHGLKQMKTVMSYLLTSLVATIAFLPWILVLVTNVSQVYRMTPEQNQSAREPLFSLIKSWLGNLSRVFFDNGFNSEGSLTLLDLTGIGLVLGGISLLIAYSLIFLQNNAPKKIWLFVFLLVGITAAFLVLPDLLLGGRRSIIGRYFMPCYLGIQLAVAYLISSKISTPPRNIQKQKLWNLAFVVLISSGFLSCAFSSEATVWWNKRTNAYNYSLAALINQVSNPLLITEISSHPPYHSLFKTISLSYHLEPQVKFQFIPKHRVPELSNSFQNVFLVSPSQKLKAGIEKQYSAKTKAVYEGQEMQLLKLVR